MKSKLSKLNEKLHIPKIQGITLRWIINILGVIAVFFIIVFFVSSFSIKNYYYSNVESILSSGTSTTATDYFSSNLEDGVSLEQSAVDFIDSFSYKDKTTIWVIDSNGEVILSSSGFAIEKQDMPDYDEALVSEDNSGKFVGKIDSGEKVMAICSAIRNPDGDIVGAVRVMSSLEQVDEQIGSMVFLIFLALLIVFALYEYGWQWWSLLIFAFLYCLNLYLQYRKVYTYGSSKWFLNIYLIFVGYSGCLGLSTAIVSTATPALMYGLGTFMFFISDILLGMYHFKLRKAYVDVLNSLFYFGGIMLVVLSFFI